MVKMDGTAFWAHLTASTSEAIRMIEQGGVIKVLDLGLARFFHEDADSLTRLMNRNGFNELLASPRIVDACAAGTASGAA